MEYKIRLFLQNQSRSSEGASAKMIPYPPPPGPSSTKEEGIGWDQPIVD
jgi:hypothetical protein